MLPLPATGPRLKHKAGRKVGEYLWDLRVGEGFLDNDAKAATIEETNDELSSFTISALQKTPSGEEMGTDVGKIFAGICDYGLTCVKHVYLRVRQTTGGFEPALH